MPTPLTLKLTYDNEVRRVSLLPHDIDGHNQLCQRARLLFPRLDKYSDIQFSWIDDEGDQVFVSSDLEFEEALRVMRAGGNGYIRLNIHVSQSKVDNSSQAPPSPVSDACQDIHTGVICGECGMSPIRGIRYKCVKRDNFDICSTCEARTKQPYPMIKFYTLATASTDTMVSILPRTEGGVGGKGLRDTKKDGWKGRRHRGITCNRCNAHSFRGARFTCTVRDDFDLCATCEAKVPYQPYPMVKVYTPDQCPHGHGLVPTNSNPSDSLTCDRQHPRSALYIPTQREQSRDVPPTPPSSPCPPRHAHIRCNECGMKPILGPRYHCTMRSDYDLCSACEARQSQPHAMIKMYFPDNKRSVQGPPPGLVGPPSHLRGCRVPWHGRCGVGPWGGKEKKGGDRGDRSAESIAQRAGTPPHRGEGANCQNYLDGREVYGEEELLTAELTSVARGSTDMGRNGNPAWGGAEGIGAQLEPVTTSEGGGEFQPDSLAVPLEGDSGDAHDNGPVPPCPDPLPLAHACLSLAIAAEVEQGGEGLSPPSIEVPRADVLPQAKPMARFVRDVTMPDGSEVQPCSVFVKCWRVRNDGASAWPAQCRLVSAGGDDLLPEGSSELCCVVPSASAGEEVDISAQLVAPSAIGRHVGYFRLQDNEQNWFGQRLWADIRVTDDDVAWQMISSSSVIEDEVEDDGSIQVHHVQLEDGEEPSSPSPSTNDVTWARELELLDLMIHRLRGRDPPA